MRWLAVEVPDRTVEVRCQTVEVGFRTVEVRFRTVELPFGGGTSPPAGLGEGGARPESGGAGRWRNWSLEVLDAFDVSGRCLRRE